MSAPRARGTGRLFLFRFFPAALPGLFLSLPAAPYFPLPFRRHFFTPSRFRVSTARTL
jgi:hypothetical protein